MLDRFSIDRIFNCRVTVFKSAQLSRKEVSDKLGLKPYDKSSWQILIKPMPIARDLVVAMLDPAFDANGEFAIRSTDHKLITRAGEFASLLYDLSPENYDRMRRRQSKG